MIKYIPEVYGTVFKFLTQAQLIKIVKEKDKGSSTLADISLLYYPWDLNWRVCRALSKSDIDILIKNEGIDRQELFNCCVEKGLLDKVKILLKDDKVDASGQNNKAILDASNHGYHEIVRLLLDWRGPNREMVDPRDRDNLVIWKSSIYGRDKVVKMLLEWRGPEGETVYSSLRNNQAVEYASMNGYYKVVKLLANSPEIHFQQNLNVLSEIYNAYKVKVRIK